MPTQTCTVCLTDKDLNEFYTFKTKTSLSHHKRCKKCFNPKRQKKLLGFSALPQDAQNRIIVSLSDRRNKVKHIAEEEGIEYQCLARWIRSGKVIPAPKIEPLDDDIPQNNPQADVVHAVEV
jgi:hypothetical protein